jgi:mycofactocin precursor
MDNVTEPTSAVADRPETFPLEAAGNVLLADPLLTDPLVDADLLVEEVSIDGMCGVY